jgi:hypothetical protein
MMDITNGELCQRTADCHYQVAEFLLHVFVYKFKASDAILNSAEYTEKKERLF